MGYSPKCPYCEINDYVVLEKKFRKAGTVVGGVAGAAGATSGGTGGAAAGAAIGAYFCDERLHTFTTSSFGSATNRAVGTAATGTTATSFLLRCEATTASTTAEGSAAGVPSSGE